ncbi:MAG: DUF3604 domain-containing protein [Gammaproteobacteria bacterium]|nr:DUF3604 domain-containing protein [Gammaproteobacteria bacterium]
MFPRLLAALAIASSLLLSYAYLGATGYLGEPQARGALHGQPLPGELVRSASRARAEAARGIGAVPGKQILFGDLHVHTTWSNDAYLASLPLSGGEGSHPPADACDYARYCSTLDFWSINDHAVSLNQRRWREIKDSIRQCNAVSPATNPDVVAFLGYEWTQANPLDANSHYGHKNVIFRHTDEAQVAQRPIYAETDLGPAAFNPPLLNRMFLPLQKWADRQIYQDWNLYMAEMEAEPACPKNISSADLPANCKEGARTPAELFKKLDQAGHDSIVIPHGNTWGLYTPPNITWDKQLVGDTQNERYQYLVEVFSGHGNSEEYREWNDRAWDASGKLICPDPRPDYLPTCVQAGRIIRQRCLDAGEDSGECDKREQLARQYAVQSLFPLATVPGSEPNDWLDAGQCKDCYLPAYTYRPGGSSQYALALGNFDDPGKIRRFRFGFMASSDNHTARPGTGYKERDRMHNVEGFAIADPAIRNFILRKSPGPMAFAVPVTDTLAIDQSLMMSHVERGSSFFLTGGLVAVHAATRSRESIWGALQRKETYGTSGDRILLWFDLLNPKPDSSAIAPMGSELALAHTPRFRVRAIGAFRQQPGCPDYSVAALGEERLQHLCYGECYNPGDERKLITRIEVIRIRPQMHPNENIADLIEDSWLTHTCPADQSGCSFEFEDPDFLRDGRETVYYARAIEETSEAVNAALMRCVYDDQGQCTRANICAASPMFTDPEEDCLAPTEERAWSSPIFINNIDRGPGPL